MSQEVQLSQAVHDNAIKEPVIIDDNDLTDASNVSSQDIEDESGIKFKDWGFKIDRLFEVAYRFYKRNESKAFHPSFDVRNQMNALILQARYGNFDDRKAPDLGTLDLVGKSRRYQWSLLKGLTKTEAKSKFICTLDNICPLFKAYADAVKISSESQLQIKPIGIASIEAEQKNQHETDEQLKTIRTSLNRQTYNQFKNYAEKQYPDDQSKQKYLIDSLQDQYYKQYISQMHPELNNIIDQDETSTPPVTSIDPSGPTAPRINDLTSDVHSISPITKQNLLQSNNLLEDSSNQSEINSSTEINIQLDKLSLNHEPTTPVPPQVQSSLAENQFVESDIVKNKIIDGVRELTGLRDEHLVSQQSNGSNAETSNLNYESRSNESSVIKDDCNYKQDVTYQSIAPKNIGKFESFPEPVPYRKLDSRNSQASTIVDLSSFEAHSTRQATSPKDSFQTPPLEKPQEPPLPKLPAYGPQSAHEPENQQPSIQPSQVISSKVEVSTDSQQLASVDRPEVETWSCHSSSGGGSPLQTSTTYEPLEQASIWTKKGVFEFRESLVNDKHGGTYIVKQATSLTIQVPTYPDGRYIYWEFATEDYDIGFGLDFIYEMKLEKPLALKIYEETDEDDDYDLDDCDFIQQEGDLELANQIDNLNELERREALLRKRAEKFSRSANSISIVPTYRRESHEEVFVGRHKYPGQGYYLLKFDNTYSVLRSKTLFFRVCYFI